MNNAVNEERLQTVWLLASDVSAWSMRRGLLDHGVSHQLRPDETHSPQRPETTPDNADKASVPSRRRRVD
jgi:hypothetical protein